jgi:hypothetical protein
MANKSVFFLLILCTLSPIIQAQEFSPRDGWGVVGGANFSDVVGNIQYGNEPNLGIRGGFSLESTIMSSFYFRSEFLYSQKGTRYNQGFGFPSFTQNYHTVEVPLLGCFEFIKGVGIGGGLYVDYLLSYNANIQFQGSTIPQDLDENNFRKLGLGYLVELNFYSGKMLQGGIRYQRSINTINIITDQYHQVISGYIGLLFNNAK